MTKKTGPRGSQTNKLPLIILGAVTLLLAMAVSVGVTWYVVTSETGGPTVETPRLIDRGAIYEELREPFVVNFNRQGRTRYLQVSVTLMGRDGDGLAALKEHMPVLRNQLVMLFSGQDFDALLTAPGKEGLRQLATAQVQELARQHLGKPVVENVLFTNFVLQ